MPHLQFHIKPIGTDELTPWRSLRKDLWPQASEAEHRQETEELLSQPERYLAVIAMSPDGDALGFAEASIRRDYVNGCDTSPAVFLEGVYVSPLSRRMGVARALCTSVEQWGVLQGCEEFASDTDINNVDSQRLHKALGFAETERVVFFRKRCRTGTTR
ncbi:aminoglycoside 6'-N-acetyltransferase [Pandoraea oxalativorans]|uniref:Aminoglycoside N(6')-acetyltransferase type 1 n=1 Tax=Pandoraea oxalativorans TaxID=573737 RepID=A0A0E3U8Y3_9BURK|nr:aminoglycoside 6'-N-acetyltransferase [Pandoraea oxalativorans]AKC71723.1 aminoglycoside 6'-acetyltransferase [Pandoraea oxalativorans]